MEVESVARSTLGVIQKNINACRDEFFRIFPDGDDRYYREADRKIKYALQLVDLIKTSSKESLICLQDALLLEMDFYRCDSITLDIGMVLFLTCGILARRC